MKVNDFRLPIPLPPEKRDFDQDVQVDYPPNYQQLIKWRPVIEQRKVIFAWGQTVYNPHNINLTAPLMNHEAVHGIRQMEFLDVQNWWDLYIEDPSFRLSEELLGHHAEWYTRAEVGNRPERRKAMAEVAAKMASPIYGPMCTKKEAMRLIRKIHSMV